MNIVIHLQTNVYKHHDDKRNGMVTSATSKESTTLKVMIDPSQNPGAKIYTIVLMDGL